MVNSAPVSYTHLDVYKRQVPFMLIGIFIPDKALALLGADAGLIGLGRNYVRIIPVSYTHLDVYKRQFVTIQ